MITDKIVLGEVCREAMSYRWWNINLSACDWRIWCNTGLSSPPWKCLIYQRGLEHAKLIASSKGVAIQWALVTSPKSKYCIVNLSLKNSRCSLRHAHVKFQNFHCFYWNLPFHKFPLRNWVVKTGLGLVGIILSFRLKKGPNALECRSIRTEKNSIESTGVCTGCSFRYDRTI